MKLKTLKSKKQSPKGGDPQISGTELIHRGVPRQLDKLTRLSSKYTPPRGCNTCELGAQGACPLFKPNHVCAFQEVIESFRIDQAGDVKEAIKALIEKSMERVQFASIAETLTGKVADQDLSNMIKQTGILVDIANKVLNQNAPTDAQDSLASAIFNGVTIEVQRPSVERIVDTDILALEDEGPPKYELLRKAEEVV